MSNGRFPWKAYVITFVVIVLIAAAPLLSVIFTAYIAEANGCVVDEGSVHSCMIGGSDWGETLYFTGMMGWFMLATIPLGGGALIVWFVLLVIHYIAWRRKALMP